MLVEPVASARTMSSSFLWFFLSLKGRIARQEFWLGVIGLIVITLLLKRPLEELSLSYFRPRSGPWYSVELDVALALPMLGLQIALLWPALAIQVKRLHDLNLSAWWLLFLPAVAVFAWTINLKGLDIALWGNLALFIILGFVPGSQGSNRFNIERAARG
jgi:uncharacterized membrane protein YhaH (DUF805 family)